MSEQVTDAAANASTGAAAALLDALALPRRGALYDLSSGWWHGMPVVACHPQFNVLSYRTPRGMHLQRDLDFIADGNDVRFSFISELMTGTAHTGTHIDALCHITCGDDHSWHGGVSADTHLGDFGALSHDAAALGPLVARGVLLDVAGTLGGERLPANFGIDGELLQRTAARQGVELCAGDVVLVRTGQMRDWPDVAAMAVSDGAGVDDDGGRWLARHRPAAVGADTASFERLPSGVPGNPHPVHLHLLREHGIPIMEWVSCEALARDEAWTFLFVALPLSIRGATGSMIRPVAIA